MNYEEFDKKAKSLITTPTVDSVLAEVDRRIQSLKLKEPVKVSGTFTDPAAAGVLAKQIATTEQAIKDYEDAALKGGETKESLAADATLARRKENLANLKAELEALKGADITWVVSDDPDGDTGVGDDPEVRDAALANAGRILEAAIKQKEREVASETKRIGNAAAALSGRP